MSTHKGPSQPVKLQFLVLGAAAAGKTSILRRYFYKTFQAGTRVPTLGSDFYTGRVPHPGDDSNDGETIQIRLQMWDTPGRERFASKRRQQYETNLTDSFFRQASAILLVYDQTSSTSFTQLLKWYADLMDLPTPKQLPILIVGNKMDIFQSDQDGRAPHHPPRVSTRDVFGLSDFGGKDFRYEYRVSPVQPKNTTTTTQSTRQRNSKRMEISSFLANRDNWTTDGSYLDSLLNSEDGSHPDKEMVVLWCMRNGLKHFEVSAATGEGVDEAIDALVLLALESKAKKADNVAPVVEQNGTRSYQRNQKLDLHQRYAPKEECSFCRPLIRWFQRIGA